MSDVEAQEIIPSAPAENPYSQPTPRELAYTSNNAVEEDYCAFQNPQGPIQLATEDHSPGMLICAITGCLFSWIPFIGCLTFILNADAPQGSTRKVFAFTACGISMIVVVLIVLLVTLVIVY
jgi:hypothetical protein